MAECGMRSAESFVTGSAGIPAGVFGSDSAFRTPHSADGGRPPGLAVRQDWPSARTQDPTLAFERAGLKRIKEA